MPAPYSLDLRQKAIAAVERGERKSDVCRTLSISRNTLDLWLKRQQETGSAAPITHYPRGLKPKIDDLDAFRAFVEKYGHLTQKEMAELWPTPVSPTLIRQALRKIGVPSRTKRATPEPGTK